MWMPRYKFSLKDDVDLTVEASKVAMTDLAVRPRDSESDWIGIPAMTLLGASLDLARRQAQVDSLSLTGMKVAAWLEPDGSVNLLKLAAAAPNAPIQPRRAFRAARALRRRPQACGRRPQARHGSSNCGNSICERRAFRPRIAASHPAVKVELAPLVVAGPRRQPRFDQAARRSRSILTSTGPVRSTVSGEVTPQPAAASLNLKLAAIDLTAHPTLYRATYVA